MPSDTVTVAEVEPPGGAGRPIVIGFDRSATSLAALERAAVLGDRLGAPLAVVHAVDLGDFPVDPDSDDWEQAAQRALGAERDAVTDVLAGYRWGWTYRVTGSDPAGALASTAVELHAEMIVVGTRGEGWRHILDRLVSPSVSHRTIATAHCPVLVVSDPGRA